LQLDYTPQENVFRQEVKDFLKESLPSTTANAVRCGLPMTKEIMEEWHAILNKKGWLGSTWLKEYGGTGWSPVERHIFEEECCMAYAPRVLSFSLHMLGPVIQRFGNDSQKAEILPRILNGDDWWCQGYSEPGSGSDLASLKTQAVKDADHYIINGQKTWTTLGQYANKIFCLVRTDKSVKPQKGISFILVDLDTPGIEMRPIRLLDGGYEVNEVFFTDVRVPVENLVGKENEGWTIAKFLLTHERTNIAGVGFSSLALEEVKRYARTIIRNGKRLIEDPLFASRVAELEIDLEAMRITNLRMLYKAKQQGAPGPETSILKIKGTSIRQSLNDLARRAFGPSAAPFSFNNEEISTLVPEEATRNAAKYFNNRKLSIYGGSNEIQRNIVSKAMLEL